MHVWTEASLIQVLIQAEAGSCERNTYNEVTLEYLETRRVARPYPYPYGFVIGTRAADGDGVDCYLITTHRLKAGTIVTCEPVGLLAQTEGEELDHKVLAALPGEDVVLGEALLQGLQDFIHALFEAYPGASVRVGPILPREAALHHLQQSRPA